MTTRLERSRTIKNPLAWDESRIRRSTRGGSTYPPVPGPFEPTGVIAGTPGVFTPIGATLPADLVALQALGALGETTAWTTSQFVGLGDSSSAHWDGDSWAAGAAP